MVLMHARAYHVFSPDTQSAIESIDPASPSLTVSSKNRLLVRRNSISSTAPTSDPVENDLPPPSYQKLDHLSITDPATPQSTFPPQEFSDEELPGHSSPAYRALKAAAEKRDPIEVVRAVSHFLATAVNPSVQEYNMALEALCKTRVPGQPLNLMLETYNDMVTRSIYPSIKTYSILILALSERDLEIHKAIASFESRNRRVSLWKKPKIVQAPANQKQIDNMRLETNFSSAYSLFVAASSMAGPNHSRLPYVVYNNLMRCASHYGNVDAALSVLAQMERRKDLKPSVSIYTHLISAYVNSGDTAGAREVLDEYIESARNNFVLVEKSYLSLHRLMWNKMIGAYLCGGQPDQALSLLEEMMDAKSDAEFDPLQPPSPDSSTYTRIIHGFCEIGDVKTALSWFERLLQQPQDSSELSSLPAVPPPPDHLAWTIMFEGLTRHNMVDDLNRIFSVHLNTATRDGLAIRAVDRITVFEANMQALDAPGVKDEYAIGILDFLSTHVLVQDLNSAAVSVVIHESSMYGALTHIARKYLKHKHPSGACAVLERCFQVEIDLARTSGPPNDVNHLSHLKQVVHEVFPEILRFQYQMQAPFQEVLRVLRLSDSINLLPSRSVAPYFLHSFASHISNSNELDLTIRDWDLLIYAAIAMEDVTPRITPQTPPPELPDFAFTGIPLLLECIAHHQVPLEKLRRDLLRRLMQLLVSQSNKKSLDAFLSKLDPNYEQVLKTYISLVMSPEPPRSVARVANGNVRNDAARYHVPENPVQAYEKFERELEAGRSPSPITIGWLINSLGRIGEFKKVGKLYDVGQEVLAGLECDKQSQSRAWFQIEDSMIMAYAHGGNVEAAHVHRQRILDQSGAPSADAYGALIQSVKDTTDDCSNALALFEESQARGVAPNLYLYNTIISKLAKARKADHAIELFHQMKSYRLNPSSITFGAIIAACARVGDTLSAESLFEEMAQQSNFKPRIPPYNTMIQMYTTTKPNRERALFYYQRLLSARLAPTSHTYKVHPVLTFLRTCSAVFWTAPP
jgi:pentatricopeptide repeat protein